MHSNTPLAVLVALGNQPAIQDTEPILKNLGFDGACHHRMNSVPKPAGCVSLMVTLGRNRFNQWVGWAEVGLPPLARQRNNWWDWAYRPSHCQALGRSSSLRAASRLQGGAVHPCTTGAELRERLGLALQAGAAQEARRHRTQPDGRAGGARLAKLVLERLHDTEGLLKRFMAAIQDQTYVKLCAQLASRLSISLASADDAWIKRPPARGAVTWKGAAHGTNPSLDALDNAEESGAESPERLNALLSASEGDSNFIRGQKSLHHRQSVLEGLVEAQPIQFDITGMHWKRRRQIPGLRAAASPPVAHGPAADTSHHWPHRPTAHP